MKVPPGPDDAARIEALRRYRILDTEPEPAFDEMAALAAQICGCPVGLITFVDEGRQWFKSVIGLELGETARELAFCSRTILQETPLIVPDLLADERFRNNPFVTGDPNLRFYAGSPLRTPDGFSLGSLCVLDRKPRTLSPLQLDALRTLSGQVMALLELRRRLLEEKEQTEKALSESEHFTREIIDGAAEGIIVYDRNLRYVAWNPSMERLTGTSASEVLGRSALELFPHLAREGIDALLSRALAGETVTSPDVRYEIPRTGRNGWVVGTYSPHRSSRGEIVGVIGMVRDITQRKEMEESLRASQQRFRAMVEHSSDAIAVVDPEGTIRYIGPSTRQVLGYTDEELIGRNGFEIVHSEDRQAAEALLATVVGRSRGTAEARIRALHRDGSWRWLDCMASNLIEEPAVNGVVVNFRDVTERKRTEDIRSALFRIAEKANSAEDLEAFYAAIHEIVSELVFGRNFYIALYDAASNLIHFPCFVDELDTTPSPKQPGKGLTEIVLRTGEPLLADAETFRRMAAAGEVELVGAPSVDWLGVPLKRGEVVFGVLAVQSYTPETRFGAAERDLLTFISQHIAAALERKRTEEAVRASEERFRKIFSFAPIGIYQTLEDGTLLAANPAFVRMVGYGSVEELLRHNIEEIYFHPEERSALLERYAAAGGVSDIDVLWKKRDGTPVWIQLSAHTGLDEAGRPHHFEGFVRDVTAQKNLEEQLRQSQKMEAVGRLAGGIAHDFNNLLTAVLGYSDLVLQQLDDHHPMRHEIEEIRRAGERAANLTGQLLAFSRRQVLVPEVLDLNAVIANLGTMLRRLIGEDVELEFGLSPELHRMRGDVGQIEQVILNLSVNARDAMPQGGRLSIETANVRIDDADILRLGAFFQPGQYVLLAVCDTGTGMDPETRSHIFEPFFTTKDRSKGTGLGLATVYGIVKQSDGYIFVDSQPGRGATFRVYFPEVSAVLPPPRPVSARAPAAHGHETILVVEDEDAVRSLALRILRESGYQVLEARAGEEALEIVMRHAGTVDLLLSDIVMPGMSGRALADRFRPLRPAAKVMFMSGYTDDTIVHHGALDRETAFLAKPFTPEALLRRVREALDGRPPDGPES